MGPAPEQLKPTPAPDPADAGAADLDVPNLQAALLRCNADKRTAAEIWNDLRKRVNAPAKK